MVDENKESAEALDHEEPISPGTEHPALWMRPLPFVVVALLGIFVLYQVVGGGLTLLIFGQAVTEDNVGRMRVATMVAQVLFLLIPTLVLLKVQHGSVRSAVAWRIPKISEILLAVAAVFSLQQVLEGYLFFQDKIPIPRSLQPFIEMVRKMIEEAYRLLVQAHTAPELLFVILVVSLTPAVCEELLFRGLIQKNVTLATNAKTGSIVTGIIFGLYHVNPFLVVPLVSLGILFGFFRMKSASILVPMIAHFTNNLISTVGLYLDNEPNNSAAASMFNSLSDFSSKFVVSSMLGFGIVFVVTMYFYLQVVSNVGVPVAEGGPQ